MRAGTERGSVSLPGVTWAQELPLSRQEGKRWPTMTGEKEARISIVELIRIGGGGGGAPYNDSRGSLMEL